MDKSKKIMIGAIGTVVVAGGVIIGLILGRTPPKADLSTIHTEKELSNVIGRNRAGIVEEYKNQAQTSVLEAACTGHINGTSFGPL